MVRQFILVIFFFFSFYQLILGQYDWTLLNPMTTQKLNSVQIIDTNFAFIVGTNGTILKTSDGGETWTSLNSGTSENLYDIQFTNTNTGFAVGHGGTILKTSDGGINWEHQNSGISGPINSISFFNENYGLAIATSWNDSGSPVGPDIIQTNDGGGTWININSKLNDPRFKTFDLYDIIVPTTNKIIIVGYDYNEGLILNSEDGGENWMKNRSIRDMQYNGIDMVSAFHGMIVGGDYSFDGFSYELILQTTNGNFWDIKHNQYQDFVRGYMMYDLDLLDPNTAFIVGANGTINKTNDGGETLIKLNSGTYSSLYSISMQSSEYGIAVGYYGTIIKTSDGGDSWHSKSGGSKKKLNNLFFIDNNSGFVVGIDGTVLKTNNGGLNWTEIEYFTESWRANVDNVSVCFSGNLGLVVGNDQDGNIFFTSDSGENWSLLEVTYSNPLYDITLTSGYNSFAVGANGKILYSENNVNWYEQTSNVSENLYGVSFIDNDNGIIVGGGFGTILTTTNAGSTWQLQSSGTYNILYDVQYIEQSTIIAVGQNGTIIKSTDGGSSWESQVSGITKDLKHLFFTDELNGFVIGFGTILYTTDGGNSWLIEENNSYGPMNGGFPISSTSGYMVGNGGIILKYDKSTPISVIDNNKLFTKFKLFQNYPNPFNPTTTISYSIPKSGFVKLKIYDVLGKEVATLVNEEMTMGKYKIEFDASGLPSGVYFYRLQSGSFTETKKLILLR